MKEKIIDLEMVEITFSLNLTELTKSSVVYFFAALEEMFELFPKGFPRHGNPSRDQENLYGSSWTEELNLTKYFVKKAFNEIGVHYKSREEYEQAKNKFQGKYYCSVYDASNHHRTFYYRNDKKFDKLKLRWLIESESDGNKYYQELALAE